MNIFKKLKSLRSDLKLTLREVAEMSGVSNPLISQIETGKVKSPGFFTIVKLAKVYRISLDDLAEQKNNNTVERSQATDCKMPNCIDRDDLELCTKKCAWYTPAG